MNTTLNITDGINTTLQEGEIINVTTDWLKVNFEGVVKDAGIFGKHEFLLTRPWTAIPTIVILSIASFVGTAGNILTLLAIASSKNLRNVEAIFIVNLAIADLYVTLIADPMSIVAKLEGEHFFNRIPKLCQIIANLCTISCVTSLMTIATMSFNRYIYVCRSEYYHKIFSKRNSIIICCSLYCVGLILVLLNQLGIGDHSFDRKSLECIWDRMATFSYTVVFSVTLVWIPCLIIGVCYLKLYLFVRRHKQKVNNHRNGVANIVVPPSSAKPQPQLGKTFILIYAVFVTCWAPYALLIVLDLEDKFPHEVHLYITIFAHLHPSVNWLIYYLTHRKISHAYCRMLRIRKRETSGPSKNFTFGDDYASKTALKDSNLKKQCGNNNKVVVSKSIFDGPATGTSPRIESEPVVNDVCRACSILDRSVDSGIDCIICEKSQNSKRINYDLEHGLDSTVFVELHMPMQQLDKTPADIAEELSQNSTIERNAQILTERNDTSDIHSDGDKVDDIDKIECPLDELKARTDDSVAS